MIHSKLHNPIIASNSFLSNAVIEKLDNNGELAINDSSNTTPIIPETGRIWYNTDNEVFKFVNINNGEIYIDEFLSKTDTRIQNIISKIEFKNSISIIKSDLSKLLNIDKLNESFEYNGMDVQFNTATITILATDSFTINDGIIDKIIADHTNNELTLSYATTSIISDVSVDGNMIISGDLTVGGQTTKVDIAAENMTIADNIIILNSNLTTEDPRLASTIVDGVDVDMNAGIAVNRGSEGVVDLIKWVESTDTSTNETLKEATANISIWNYESATPSYELHQIIDSYTLGRKILDKSGASWIGYDGYEGINYIISINDGVTETEALKYSYKLDAGKLDNVVDNIVQKIDHDSFNRVNNVRVGETTTAGTSFQISHNLGTVYVDVRIQREDNDSWFFDTLPIEVIDENTILIETSESTKIRYMISTIEGFDIDQTTDLIIT